MSQAKSQFRNLLSPLSISHPGGELTLRNRIMVSAHVPGFAENNKPGADYIAYHQKYAAEGVALQLTGGTPVHKSGLLSLAQDALWNLDDSIIPGYQKLSAAVHAEGGRILAQLAHSGGTVKIDLPGVTSWSASPIRSSITGHVSHGMTVGDIQEMVQAYADGAYRVQEGGLDGVEILAAFGYLPQAFLSPLSNFRQDKYGGSLENRMRFLEELLVAVRKQLGKNQLLGVRLPGDEFEPGGLTMNDMKLVCKRLSEQGLIDYLNITAHTNFTPTGRSKHWAPTPSPHGVFVELAAAIKKVATVPVFTVGRIVDPIHAERIISRNEADMVGMTRAHICDPEIVRKITQRQHEQIRPCVGANTCIANRYNGKTIRCMHNPQLKSPGSVLLPTSTPKNVVVVGAGPAGLEAARLSAMRGHKVSVFEATSAIGGQLAYWARSSSMKELGRIIDWRQAELDRLDVQIELNRELSSSDMEALNPDILISAIGATETKRTFSGNSTIAQLTPMALLNLKYTDAKQAIVVSDGRGQAGLVSAEWLLHQGVQVEIITEDIAIANDLDPTNRNAWYERLGKLGAVLTPQSVLKCALANSVTVCHLYSQIETQRNNIDLIIDWNGCCSREIPFAEDLRHQDIEVHKIGDCVAPRNVELAMAEALDVAESI